MLAPEDRALYTDCLRPPPGYEFNCGIGTTFTLDLETLLVVPLVLSTFGGEKPADALESPLPLFDGIRRHADRLLLFCQHDRIAVPRKQQALFGMLEGCVVPVRAPRYGGIFHPKMWLLRYVNEQGDHQLRVLVSSRNLTFDRSWDVILGMEGRPGTERVTASEPVGRLIETALGELPAGPVDNGRVTWARELADQATRTSFESPEGFHGKPRFHVLGLDRQRWQPVHKTDRVLAVSPFVGPGPLAWLRRATEGQAPCELVARGEEMDRLGKDALAGWRAHELADTARDDADAADEAEPAADDVQERTEGRGISGATDDELRDDPTGLHAKLLVAEQGQRVRWWLGSANLTDPAWNGTNVELMVELRGHRDQVGIDAFLDGGEPSFRSLLELYERSADTEPEFPDREHAQQLAEQTRDRVAEAELALTCRSAGEGWTLRLTGEMPVLPDNVQVHVWPVSLPARSWQQQLEGDQHNDVAFEGIAAASVTSLMAFSVTADVGEAREEVRFARKLPHDGFPSNRHAHIVRSIIRSQENLFRYLRLLLADAGSELVRRLGDGGLTSARSDAGQAQSRLHELVLEDLVRAVSRNPEQLGDVARLIAELRESPEGAELLPEEFTALWEAVESVVKERSDVEVGTAGGSS